MSHSHELVITFWTVALVNTDYTGREDSVLTLTTKSRQRPSQFSRDPKALTTLSNLNRFSFASFRPTRKTASQMDSRWVVAVFLSVMLGIEPGVFNGWQLLAVTRQSSKRKSLLSDPGSYQSVRLLDANR